MSGDSVMGGFTVLSYKVFVSGMRMSGTGASFLPSQYSPGATRHIKSL
eukprot:CAMPEP_0119516078 /NCGR_PEP_ID=MMETSP1344-20130328/33374_1 /TAXON_ID=236787 /ORGANISM="Florenciella parvula, Strain CCMP2471" /LENGTH=47 /DNA_ID= /DNA_START= /DNA_END= /DNA_ORIENTATION=